MWLQFPMAGGIGPARLLLERSRDVMNGRISPRLEGMGPVRWLLERSNPVKLVQFVKPIGNGPLRPMSDRCMYIQNLALIRVPTFHTSKSTYETFTIVVEIPGR